MLDEAEYERVWRDGFSQGHRWVLVLDSEQRDNLLQLLNVVGFPTDGIAPFTIMNSGDWVGEIALMLASPGTEAAFQMLAEKTGEPLLTREEVLRRLSSWSSARYGDRELRHTDNIDRT